MTLRMADSTTVALLPATFDAYAGYVDGSRITPTWPMLVQRFGSSGKPLLSIDTQNRPGSATCLDIEQGDATLGDAPGWVKASPPNRVLYTSVDNVNSLVAEMALNGIPRTAYRLWSAHYTGSPHLCSAACTPGLVTTADATQWTDSLYGRNVDQSLVSDSFFGTTPNLQPQQEVTDMVGYDPISGGSWGVKADGSVYAYTGAPYLGGLNNHPEWHTAQVGTVAGIAAWKGDGTPAGGNGYVIYVETAQGFDLYRFPGSGALAK